jgi:sRNA-binding carbon storage regulator CsrA
MASRIRLFDRTGTLIYEVGAPAFREWVLNDIGSASFTIKAAGMEPYIEFGNFVTIENDKLDTWVGVVIPPRTWSPKIITVNAKSAMSLFGQRVGSYEQPVSGSWGEVLSQVIGIANSAEDTLMQIGTYDAGISYSSVVDMSNLYTYLQRALAQAQTRLDFRPVTTNGKLKIFIDMKPTLYTTSNLYLEEGLNVKNNTSILIQQGEIYNDITILGVGLDQVKVTANAVDQVSIEKYGRRQRLFSEGQSQADVDRLAVVRLAQYAYPRNTLALTTMDKGNTLLYTRVGNSGSVKLRSVGYLNGGLGFQGTASIRVIQYDDKNKEVVLVCEET